MPRPKIGQEKQKTRPQKLIDWDKVDQLLIHGNSGAGIAAYFGMHPETFYDRIKLEKGVGFSEYQQEKQALGKSLIRSMQFQKAMKGDGRMLVHVGKHYLGQHDRIHQDINSTQTISQVILYLPDNGRDQIKELEIIDHE